MRAYFTPLRVLTVAGLGLLLVLWICSMVGQMAKTRLGTYYRTGCFFTSGTRNSR